ncbi:hypothetical protein [Streptomyces sp. NPDC020607]|uniref:hypothetical protein n=1 Tax=Streptomyces sp. NPDC020607 TaxID=3365082 RepID=UPI0037A56E56
MNEGDAVAVEAEGAGRTWAGRVRPGNGVAGVAAARGDGVRADPRRRRLGLPPVLPPGLPPVLLPVLLAAFLAAFLTVGLLPLLTAAPALAAPKRSPQGPTQTTALAALAAPKQSPHERTQAAAPTPSSPSPSPQDRTQAATVAAHLRSDPVYVTDQLPRAVPRSTAPDYTAIAAGVTERTGVRTYVLVLPGAGSSMESKALLGAVHDRLGRDGLYVLIDEYSVSQAVAFGVRAPAEDAWSVQLHELPSDAGPLLSFERFADVIALGPEKAAQRAEAAREKYGSNGAHRGGGEEPDELHIGPTDRRNQSFLTGIALTGLPLLVLLISPYVRRWWRRRRTPAVDVVSLRKGDGEATPPRPPSRPRPLHWVEAAVALALAAAVALTATALFDQTTSSASPPPTGADLASRVDRVTDGLRHDPVYSDPESPRPLTPRQLADLRSRMKDADYGSVRVALVPQLPEDESGGNPEVFADALYRGLGKSGVYVVADPLTGDIDVVTYGVRIDANLVAFDLPDAISYDDSDERSADHRLGERLDDLLTFLADAPRTDTPETSSLGTDAPDPVEDAALPRLFSTDFWPGLLVGAIGAVFVFLVVAAVLGILGHAVPGLRPAAPGLRVVRPRNGGGGGGGSQGRGRSAAVIGFDAPTDPSSAYLRRTAREELDALAREFDPDAALPSGLRTRVWDCLDTATLLADRNAGGPDGRVDDDVPAADLAAAVALARMGRAALANRDTDKPCCALNPLHGPATGWRDAQYAPEDTRRRTIPVCDACRAFVTERPDLAHTRRLTLPSPSGGRGADRVPYEDAAGPLPAARRGVPQLIRQVREYAGVQ